MQLDVKYDIRGGMIKSKKKIAIISPSFPPSGTGGVTTSHFNLHQILKKKYLNVRTFTLYDISKNKKSTDGVVRFGPPKIYMEFIYLLSRIFFGIIDPRKHAFEVRDILQAIPSVLKLNKFLDKYNPDIIVAPDHGSPVLFLKKPSKSKLFLISHHNPKRFDNKKLFLNHSTKDINMAIYLENITLKKVDHVICPSKYMKNEFVNTYKFNKSISVVHNMLNESLVSKIKSTDLHKKMGLNKRSRVIYIPSAESIYKGSLLLPKIIKKISSSVKEEVGFYLSGDISKEQLLKIKKATNNIAIFAPGKVNYSTNMSFVKGCDFAISPTLIESFGMAILEASFCGLPVVSFSVGGVPEIIKDGENGFLVKLLDINSLVEKAKLLFDGKKLYQMKKNTIKIYNDKFHSKFILTNFEKLLKQ